MKTFWQILILSQIILGLFVGLWRDFNGRAASGPTGFAGGVASIVITVLLMLLYWAAGAFTELF